MPPNFSDRAKRPDESLRLTAKQRAALDLIRAKGMTYAGDPNVYAAVTTAAATRAIPEAWINWRTAEALERRGYGQVAGYGEECEFTLWPERRTNV